MNLEIKDGVLLGGNITSVQYEEARNQQIEASQPEVIKGGPLPSMPELMRDKKPTLKYLSVTGMFNRGHKRELAQKLTRQNRKRRAIRSVLCSTCQLSFTAKTAARCQCPVIKPAKKEANAD